MDFMNQLKDQSMRYNLDKTENGAIVYKSCGNKLIDFNFHISAYRDASKEKIMKDFIDAYDENVELAMRYLFFVRDIQEGLGERHVFRSILCKLTEDHKDIVKAILPFIPEYGRWDDLLDLIETPLQKDVIDIIKNQLDEDMKNANENNPISLCAKWMPSINASNANARKRALILCDSLGMQKKDYRKMLSSLRNKLNIIEKYLAEKDIDKLKEMQEIFSTKQHFKYKDALMKIMPEERKKYLNDVLEGKAKFNGDIIEPHEIYSRYRSEILYTYDRKIKEDITYETMWKMLPNKVKPETQTLVVRDGSGSMTELLPNSNRAQAIDVSSALAVYFSQNTTGYFKDKFITFSSRPEIVDISKCKTLNDKIRLLEKYDDYSNTDIEKTFDLILSTAIDNHLSQDELPKNILIISDMEFDTATYSYKEESSLYTPTLFDAIRNKYEEAGYLIPRLIFWNVANRTNTIPEIKNELGIVLLGGYSKNNVDMICEDAFTETVIENGEKKIINLKPEEVLAKRIMAKRYDPISEAIKDFI